MQLEVVHDLLTIVGLENQGMDVAAREKTERRGYPSPIDEDLDRCLVDQQPNRQARAVGQWHMRLVGR